MNYIFKEIRKNNKGATLLEMLVAVALFSVTMLSATQIFSMVVEGQRNSIAAQNIQENMRYAFETMAKEIRMARGAHGGSSCDLSPVGTTAFKVFNTSESMEASNFGDELYFENKNGDCVRYYLEDDAGISRLKVDRDINSAFITPDDLNLEKLLFYIEDDEANEFHEIQPSVTIMMEARAMRKEMHKQEMKIQTTISSRYYE
ncbi:MAG: prepilin-type N-terminal cleavage/methylation domain-containing protein [Patescibacteria group bacterium]